MLQFAMPNPRLKDLTGRTFGKLTVVERAPNRGGRVHWRCSCECGAETTVAAHTLSCGHTTSCGCAVGALFKRSHGLRESRTYNIWCHMKGRCGVPTNVDYRHYGARGITVCERWLSFENFVADMGEAPAGYSIERKDTNGNYEPSNCVWIPATEQPRNTRRSRYALLNGERMIFSDVARKLNVSTGLVTMWAKGQRRVPPDLDIAFT